jgi:hypothetical protein
VQVLIWVAFFLPIWGPALVALILLAIWWRRRVRAASQRALTGYAANRAANRRFEKRFKYGNRQ